MNRERQFALALILIGWAAIFAVTCDAKGEGADPCAYESDQAYSVCYAYGARSRQCRDARADLEFCRIQYAGDDPIEGASNFKWGSP